MVKNHHLAKSISDASWSQFTQWLDYYGKVWDKAVVAVSPNYTSQDCSNCGHRVKKSLSTRTHSCSSCGVEICRDTNAAINILIKGMKVVGYKWQSGNLGGGGFPRQGFQESGKTVGEETSPIVFTSNSTQGHWESASLEGKHGEKSASTIDGQLDIASELP